MTLLPTAVAAALLVSAVPDDDDQSQCICEYHKTVETSIEYRRTFLRVIGSGFGLWGSTRKCVTITNIKWSYDYSGPGDPPPDDPNPRPPQPVEGPSSLTGSTLRSSTGTPIVDVSSANNWTFRWMSAQSTCSGDLRRPDPTTTAQVLSYIALDGSSFTIPIQPVTGTLQSFLGTAFDPTDYDPAFVNSASWTGVEGKIPAAAFVAPTLTLSSGGDPGTPVGGTMDLSNPDAKTLALDLGRSAGNRPFSVLVSSTSQDEGVLGVVDGVTLPIVIDDTTRAFLLDHPQLAGTTDGLGRASVNFPLLTDAVFDGADLSVAIVAHDPVTGAVTHTSTYVGISTRDLSDCD